MNHEDRKRRRCFHRVISGIEKWGLRNLRFITLTSQHGDSAAIQYSWRRLLGYLTKAGRISAYIKCLEYTKAGRPHLHILYVGKYIPQFCLSAAWSHIHGAPVVHIEAVYGRRASIASYLAKYMSKADLHGRGYSWSYGWVHCGLVRAWCWFKRRRIGETFADILDNWHNHIRRIRLIETLFAAGVGKVRVLTDGGSLRYIFGERCWTW